MADQRYVMVYLPWDLRRRLREEAIKRGLPDGKLISSYVARCISDAVEPLVTERAQGPSPLPPRPSRARVPLHHGKRLDPSSPDHLPELFSSGPRTEREIAQETGQVIGLVHLALVSHAAEGRLMRLTDDLFSLPAVQP